MYHCTQKSCDSTVEPRIIHALSYVALVYAHISLFKLIALLWLYALIFKSYKLIAITQSCTASSVRVVCTTFCMSALSMYKIYIHVELIFQLGYAFDFCSALRYFFYFLYCSLLVINRLLSTKCNAIQYARKHAKWQENMCRGQNMVELWDLNNQGACGTHCDLHESLHVVSVHSFMNTPLQLPWI